jgi:hypothetical protein
MFSAANLVDEPAEKTAKAGSRLNGIFDYDLDDEESKGDNDDLDKRMREEEEKRKKNALF